MSTVKRFNQLNVKYDHSGFEGDKIRIDRILNKEITVHDYLIVDSKYPEKGNPKCLYLQITINGIKHVVFSGSKVLQTVIEKVAKSDFPFATTIIRDNQRLEFT